MKTMSATEFKAKCLNILEHVPTEGLAITKRGKTVARLYPERQDILRFMGTAPGMIKGDILSTGVKWDAES
ncbi:MAG: type II toxin-antitoxin system Phd/YefM family antitoxin [Fimbriimonas sp.]